MEQQPQAGWEGARIYSVGHSTRSFDDFLALLRAFDVTLVVDVRTLPGSRRYPQFDKESLERTLPEAGIDYRHVPALGGLRRGPQCDENAAWRNASFRHYADYMQTDAFLEGLEELRKLSDGEVVALMCAEAVPWRCHRGLIADALFARGVEVHEILSEHKAPLHVPRDFARIDGTRVTYPAPEGDPAHGA